MNYHFEYQQITASKAIRHMQLRLSAEQLASVDGPNKFFADPGKMIEHMRMRLKGPSIKGRSQKVSVISKTSKSIIISGCPPAQV